MEKVGLRNNRKDWKPRGQRGMAKGSRLEKIMLKGSIRGEQRVKESGLSFVGTAAGPAGGSKIDHFFMMLNHAGIQGGEQCHLKGRFYSLFSFTPSLLSQGVGVNMERQDTGEENQGWGEWRCLDTGVSLHLQCCGH